MLDAGMLDAGMLDAGITPVRPGMLDASNSIHLFWVFYTFTQPSLRSPPHGGPG